MTEGIVISKWLVFMRAHAIWGKIVFGFHEGVIRVSTLWPTLQKYMDPLPQRRPVQVIGKQQAHI